MRATSARTSERAAPIDERTSGCSGRTTSRPRVAATAGTSASPAPPRTTSGTSRPSSCARAASATAVAIFDTAPSRTRCAASRGSTRSSAPSGANAARAAACDPRAYAPAATEPTAYAAHVAVSAHRRPSTATIAYSSGSPGRGETAPFSRPRGRSHRRTTRREGRRYGRSAARPRPAGDVRGAASSRRPRRRPSCRSTGCTSACPSPAATAGRRAPGGRSRRSSSCRRTRRRCASAIPSWWSAAATPAAGPDPIVSDGRCRNASTLIAPPSPRRTRSGTSSPRFVERPPDERRRRLHHRQDARVDRGADRPRLQAVGAGEVVPGAGGEPAGERALDDGVLVLRRVDRECAADGDREAAGGLAAARAHARRRRRETPGRVEELVHRLAAGGHAPASRGPPASVCAPASAPAPRRSRSRRRAPRRPRGARSSPASSRTPRARRAGRRSPSSREQRAQRVGDARRDTAGRAVRCRDDGRGARRPACCRLDCDGLRERAADVDADADAADHAARASGDAPPRRLATRTRTPPRRRRPRAGPAWHEEPLARRVDPGQLGEEDRRPRPAASTGVTPIEISLLERPHGVAGEGDREEEQDRGAAHQHRLQRQLLPELEDRVPDDGERGGRRDDAENDPQRAGPPRTRRAPGRRAPSRTPRGTRR